MATVILKATEACNSNCYYCDVIQKEGTGRSMPIGVLEATLERVDEYLAERPNETVEIFWHGGEPLLLGVDYFREALELHKRTCPGTRNRIRHSMQTNLTCLTEEFIPIFVQLGITSLGTSYDPEPGMRGPGALRDSDHYNRRFMEAVRILRDHGISWGMIYVVTRRSLVDPLGIFHFLANMLPSGAFNLNPVLIYDEHRRDIAITPEEYVEFLGAIFPEWWRNRHRYKNVQPFRALEDNIVRGARSLGCAESGSCTYVHLNIAPNGETSQCGRSSDWRLLSYGNIRERSLSQILSDPQRNELHQRLNLLYKGECAGCRFWEICHGGCPLDSWSQHKSFLHKSEWCDARRGFITKYFEPVTGSTFRPSGEGPIPGPRD